MKQIAPPGEFLLKSVLFQRFHCEFHRNRFLCKNDLCIFVYLQVIFLNKKAFVLAIKFAMFSIILVLCAILLNIAGEHLKQRLSHQTAVSAAKSNLPVVVIDAGHGGEDGGAVGINGCIEKEINLRISMMVYDLMRFSNIPVIITRDKDIMLYDNNISGRKKMQDIKNRVKIAEQYDNSILVSIHMNSYISPKYSGTQVYYSPNDTKSRALAEAIQSSAANYLQPDNTREIKKATSAIYLLYNVKRPAVLVECGFLSNKEEANLLCTDSYQRKMACIIYSSILDYLNLESNEKDDKNERL